MKLITGSSGSHHVTAADDGALYAGIVGDGLYVFDIGSKFATTIINSSTVQIGPGEGLLQGRHFRTEPGTVDIITLEDCPDGYNRNDLIGVRYTNAAGTESIVWEVIQGTATTGTAADPSYATGDLLSSGGSTAFRPLYRAKMRGPSLSGIDVMYTYPRPTGSKTPLPITQGGTGAGTAEAARNALGITPAGIGAVPIADATSESSNMDTILKSGAHFGIYKTGSKTLGTPYKASLTTMVAADILSYANSTTYGMQMAFVAGSDKVLVRSLNNGTISAWRDPASVGIQTGTTEATVAKGSSVTTVAVTFPTVFAAAPVIQLSAVGTSDAHSVGEILLAAADITTTGFNIKIHNANSSDRTLSVAWAAIGG